MKSAEATPRRRWRPSLFWLWAAPLALALADGSLAGQLPGHDPLRQRCEAALAPALQPGAALAQLFTGPLSLPLRLGADRASRGRGGVQCSKMLIGQALLAAARPRLWHHLHWRNTLDEWLLALGMPALAPYQSRQADVGLHHRALAAALTTSAVRCPTAEFSTRLAAFAPPTLAARILLADDGRTLLAARWGRSTVDGEPQPAIRVPLPAIH